MGLFDSLFGSKTKTKNSFEPYSEAKPFLLGKDGNKGIFQEASRLYDQGGFLPEMADAQTQYLQQLAFRNAHGNQIFNPAMSAHIGQAASDLSGGARAVANGAYDSNFNPVRNINPLNVDLTRARASQGVLDPTGSLRQLLSGNVANPYLRQQAQAMTADLTRNLNENVMPGLRSEALASGQYGGSRQSIAEGLAASRLNQDLAPALANLFGGAYENAQQRMFGTANALNDQAVQNMTNNVNRQFMGDQFNANLGLQNNEQLMAKNSANLGNRMKALDIANNALGLLSGAQGLRDADAGFQDANFGQTMTALGMPQDINAQNLSNYMGVIYPGAQLGGTSKGTQTSTPGIVPAVLGTLSGIAGIARGGMGGMGGAGSMFGGK